jgi:uncharacterized protein YqjF (DUF2071 family)
MRRTFLTAEWRKLAIANYSVDPDILSPYIPYKTELDFWKDKCYVSLVGFRFINTKLKGLAIPFHRNFEEVNLRFYVRYKNGDRWKRGVCFIKEIVPKPALTLIANTLYKERYITLPTKYQIKTDATSIDLTYSWKHANKWDSLSIKASPLPKEMKNGSEEEFITEHYWGYTYLDGALTSEYEVQHPRWQTYTVLEHTIDVRFGELYGAEFGMLKDALPDSVMLAEGSEISVLNPNRII